MDEHFPSIPVEEFLKILEGSPKVVGIIDVGSTKAFILRGSKFIGKRTINIRTDLPEIGYEYVMGLSILASVIGPCLVWFEKNKHFKEGGYIVPKESSEKE